jgi:hypothetical protein
MKTALPKLIERGSLKEIRPDLFWLTAKGLNDIGRMDASVVGHVEGVISRRGGSVYASSQCPDMGNEPCRHHISRREVVSQFEGDIVVTSRLCEKRNADWLQQIKMFKELESYRIKTSTLSSKCPFTEDLQNIYLCSSYEPI